MTVSTSNATWGRQLNRRYGYDGGGDGRFTGPFTRASRFADGPGNQSRRADRRGPRGATRCSSPPFFPPIKHVPNNVNTTAKVHIGQVDGTHHSHHRTPC
ncbi:MAG: hypothetical protein IPJ90_22105 [Anaerolineaceae bacterium]|nr:hypothetical protein [Anaerolineaceae bacterium]